MSFDAEALRPRLQAAVGDALQVGEVLGVGGFAAVFRAHDPFLDRDIAIKVLDPTLGVSEEREAQFLHEARTVAQVEHPHIVPLYGAEARDGLLFLEMRLLPGQSLADRIAQGPLAAGEAARIAHEVAMALTAAHERGVVHRDIKPDNILLDASAHATVTDFGISRVTSRPAMEGAGVTTGTPAYMSPEQAMGEEVDGRADVYSLGVVLFEMLTGQLPFAGRNFTELLAKVISAPAPSVAVLAPQTPAALVQLIDRLLEKDRAKRPTAAELVTLLAAARTPDALLTPTKARWKRRRRRLLYVTIAVVPLTIGLLLFGRLGLTLFRFMTEQPGEEPTLYTKPELIPATYVADAVRDGTLRDGERPRVLFIPGGRTFADGTFLTDTFIVRRSAKGPLRIRLRGATIGVNRTRRPNETQLRGVLVISRRGVRPDTLYDDLGGLDLMRLLISMWANSKQMRAAAGR